MKQPFESKDILQLIITKIDDGRSYFRFSQVNRLCNLMCKKLLIPHLKKSRGIRTWTEIPGLPGVNNGIMNKVDYNGNTIYQYSFLNGLKHGICTGLHNNGSLYKVLFKCGVAVKDINGTTNWVKEHPTRSNNSLDLFCNGVIMIASGYIVTHMVLYVLRMFINY